MQRVMMDQIIDPPVGIVDLPEMEQRGAWCMEQYRVRHVTSLLSLDGRRLVCSFDAPDAEAVRNTMRQLGTPAQSVWPCTVEGPALEGSPGRLAPNGAPLVCVDRSFSAPIVLADLDAQEKRSGWCLEQHGVHFLFTFFGLDRRRMICIYRAPDAEAVRYAQTKAQMPFDRIWAAQWFEAGE